MMILLILILLVLVVIVSFINSFIDTRRQIAFNEINALYDKMELFVVSNDELKINKRMLDFLKSYKAFKLNKELADIHILLLVMQSVSSSNFKRIKVETNLFYKTLPLEMVTLKNKCDREISNAVLLSAFRLEFLWFTFYILSKVSLRAIFDKSFKAFKTLFSKVSDILKDESLVIYTMDKYQMAA